VRRSVARLAVEDVRVVGEALGAEPPGRDAAKGAQSRKERCARAPVPDGYGPAHGVLDRRSAYRVRPSRVLDAALTASSPADAMSLAPVRFRVSFARVISSDVSQ
jgi:hypothetical protein